MTFLEVVVSLTIVVGMAAIVTGAVSMLEAAALRQKYRTEAMEVGHRVILQYIDDFEWIKNQSSRVDYNGSMYEFEFEELFLRETSSEGGRMELRAVPGRGVSLEEKIRGQIHQLTVAVYRLDEYGVRSERPLAELARWFNPIRRGGEDDRGLRWMMQQMLEAQNGVDAEDDG